MTHVSRSSLIAWSALCVRLAVAVLYSTSAAGAPVAKRETRAVEPTHVLAAWLACTNCDIGELKAVTRLGSSAVRPLVATLEDGLSDATSELLRRSLNELYDELLEQARERPQMKPASTREQFIARYLVEVDINHRTRAAQALGAIGNADARAALKEGLARAHHPRVRKAITDALQYNR
jgi:hypothetical protein